MMSLAHAWPYGISGDAGIVLFETCLRAWKMDLPTGATVVELGCHESDFAATLKRARPDVTIIGIDARPTAMDGPSFAGDRLVVGDAGFWPTWLEAGNELDAVIALSSVEHFGLGWYGDPVGQRHGGLTADVAALWYARQCLRDDGWFYYDVPWSRALPHTETAHYRRYTDWSLPHRQVEYAGGYVEHARTWVTPGNESTLLPGPPDTHAGNPHPFHYCAVWAGV